MNGKKQEERERQIGERIKQLRKESGYSSYEDFALKNDIDRKQYWRLETGTNCKLNAIFKIIDAHGITLEEFFSGLK